MRSLHFKGSWQLLGQTFLPPESWHLLLMNISLWSQQESGLWWITRLGFLRSQGCQTSLLQSLEAHWPHFFLPFISAFTSPLSVAHPNTHTPVQPIRTGLITAKESIIWIVLVFLCFPVFQTLDRVPKHKIAWFFFPPVPIFLTHILFFSFLCFWSSYFSCNK